MSDWYQHGIVDSGKQPLALLLVAFMLTFLGIRASVRMIRAGVSWWPGNVKPGGLHIHHVVFGLVILLVAGVGGFSRVGGRTPWAEIFAVAFGCGAALVLDEFALVLRLRDVYWSQEGRTSVQVVFVGVALCALLLLGAAPLGVEDPRYAGGPAALGYAYTIGLNAALVTITLLKGKVWTGLLGILLPPLALIGAVRLARPRSPWARWRYRPGSRRARRAAAREAGLRARWMRRLDWLQDLFAGRPGS